MNRKNGRHFDGFCPALALVLKLGLLYAAWLLCRIVFFLQNRAEIGPLAASELPGLLHGSLVFDTVSILYVNSLFIVLSLVPLRLRERRWYGTMLFWLFSVANALALIVNVSDGVYYHYAKKRFTSDELSYLGNNDNTGTVLLKALAENWYVALFAAGLIAALVWAYRRIRVAPSRIRSNTAYALIHLPALLVAVGLSIGGIRGGFSRQTRPITLSNATLYTASSPKANLILSNPFCMLRTLGNRSIAYTEFFDDRTLEAIYTPIHRPEAAAGDSLAFGDRNIVIFILESFSSEHSALLNPDLYPDGHGYTPFLDSLMREGYYFQNAFANGHKSIEALPSVLSSIPSYRTPFVLMPQALAPMKALPALLAEKGYKTSFFNGSGRGSMGFGAYAAQAGVQDYYSREDYEKRCGTDDFDGYWGIWDEPFLQFMGEELSETPEPFFATLFTLSSHHPFVVPARYENTLPDGYTKIHKGVAYDDNAFRLFFERFGREEWFRRTVFVFVADHVSSEKFAPVTRTYPGNYHIIGFMYTPDGALRGEVGDVVQQLDIMPTVLGLVGSEEPYFAFGRDVLNEPERPRWSVSYDGKFRALTGEGAVVLDDSGAQVQECPVTPAADSLMQSFRALIQQYYSHIERKSYTPDD